MQYALVSLLTAGHRSVFVVADDEQSIYGWRHATPEHIAQFQREFLKDNPPIVLEENYRSSAEILRLACLFISPTFQEIYLAFQSFVGIDILIAQKGEK